MSKQVIDANRASRIMGAFCMNVDWDLVPFDVVKEILHNPSEAGRQFTLFLKNRARLHHMDLLKLPINRVRFPLEEFNAEGSSVVSEDHRSAQLSEIDLKKVFLVSHKTLGGSKEERIDGSAMLELLKQDPHHRGYIRLDINVFFTLWTNQILIPQDWKMSTNNATTFICFDGTEVQFPNGKRRVVSLYWLKNRWHWQWTLHQKFRGENTQSALLTLRHGG